APSWAASRPMCRASAAGSSAARPPSVAAWRHGCGKGRVVPEWVMQLLGSNLAAGIAAGLIFVGALRVEVRTLREKQAETQGSVTRAHVRIDDHITHWHS